MPKRPPSFFVVGPIVEGAIVALDDHERRHARARRLHSGNRVRVTDGEGNEGSGFVDRIDASACEVRIESAVASARAPEPSQSVHLFVSAIRLPRLSWLVEKATELGAARVTIVSGARSQRERADAAGNARERLGRIAKEAAKQSGRITIPAIAGPIAPEDVATGARTYSTRLLLDSSGVPFPMTISGPVAIWVGPEGGWSAGEMTLAESSGWSRVRVPGATLRAETAAVAGLVLALRAIDTAPRVDGQ